MGFVDNALVIIIIVSLILAIFAKVSKKTIPELLKELKEVFKGEE